MGNFFRKVERSQRFNTSIDPTKKNGASWPEDSLKGRENVYTCDKCGGYTVTRDVDDGVTPFMIGCRSSGKEGDCDGKAYSSFYPKGPRPARIPAPSWEWYKPSDAEVSAMPESWRDHFRRGGLNLRKIEMVAA